MASIKELKRMCNSYNNCADCPFFGKEIKCEIYTAPQLLPHNADEIVDKWVEEHPIKTYAMDFFEKFPNASKDRNGVPGCCWKQIYGGENVCTGGFTCAKCWQQEMKEE